MTKTTSSPATEARSRIEVFDGLRGIAVVLVLLSHTAWLSWPYVRGSDNNPVERALMENGNYAVSFFFVIGAFLYTHGLLLRASSGTGLRPEVQVLRRYLRLTPTVLVLLAVLWGVAVLENKPTYPGTDLGRSATSVLTYTWNWYVKENALTARPDIGHLWYLSVDMQVFLLVLLLVHLLRHRRGWLIATLALLLVMVLTWRTHVYQSEGLYQALLRTNARMDAPLSGALAACLLPYLRRLAPWNGWLAAGGVTGALLLALATYEDTRFFTLAGDLLDLALAAFVLGCVLGPVPRLLTATLGVRPLATLGRRSLSVYVWHFPIYMYLYHHAADWSWQLRTAVAVVLIGVVATANDMVVERWTSRMLASPAWRRLDRGVPAYLGTLWSVSRSGEAPAPGTRATEAAVLDLVEREDLMTGDDAVDRAALSLSESDDAAGRPS